ncbi:uncharacterized protein PITG_08705 [Phytophthora infestans T30-4]|uniref:Uncharacterized protein n=1 Tax=Phytophthora infestans (strain T30-4) TaxID=403677 RepID=D0ND02_PHYIT|nr:uncharacterized protein PITG_08705 [Phytophthora infestans T30-4]EEY55959.1 hypothetical protein PITG_08705 [Phytophthora infestans T30-4]|eukprot:XP_002902789.1 hypothetical protein PITG_08705 [Phytophthora infestans T30-4]
MALRAHWADLKKIGWMSKPELRRQQKRRKNRLSARVPRPVSSPNEDDPTSASGPVTAGVERTVPVHAEIASDAAEDAEVGTAAQRIHINVNIDIGATTRNLAATFDDVVSEEEVDATDLDEACDELVTLDDGLDDITGGELDGPTDLAGQDEEVVIQPEMLFVEDFLAKIATSLEDGRARRYSARVVRGIHVERSTCTRLTQPALKQQRRSVVFLCNKVKHTYDGKARTCFDIWHACWRNGTLMPSGDGKRSIQTQLQEGVSADSAEPLS